MLVDVVAFDFKACVRYFLFHQMISPLKNYEICFLFHLKSSFRSRNMQIFAVFFHPFRTFYIQKDKWKWDNL